MNKLRQELKELLTETETVRPTVLRRSLKEGFLYVTDLPQTAERKAVSDFIRRAENIGWHAEEDAGWIQLDCRRTVLPEEGFRGPYGAEAHACASLLDRHPEGRRPGERERRMLIKAGDEGAEAFEKICAALHREWAEALRRGDALPDIPDEFFAGGENK